MMTDDEIQAIYDEHGRLARACFLWDKDQKPWELPRCMNPDRRTFDAREDFEHEMLTESQIDWLIDNFPGRGEIGRKMLDLLYISRHPKAEEWMDSLEGRAILDDETLLWDLLGGRPESATS